MNILHLVGGDLRMGAARGALWLHNGLIAAGINSKILTNSHYVSADSNVVSILNNRIDYWIDYMRRLPDAILSTVNTSLRNHSFSTGLFGYDFTKHALYQWADVIHLHWVNHGFVNIKNLSGVPKPIIWTLRDMWPMTGGCHYSLTCEKYKTGCENCELLGSRHRNDLSKYLFKRKARYYPPHMNIVGISEWTSEEARKSWLFHSHSVHTISNNLHLQDFFRIKKQLAREILGINTSKKVLLIGVVDNHNPWKGYDKFIAALQYLPLEKYFVLFFGSEANITNIPRPLEHYNLGFLSNNVLLRLAYSAADVYVLPSMQETFGKTLAESLACGTPAVCFDATGPRDIIDHKVNGYKAAPFDPVDLAFGIEWVVNSNEYELLSANGISKVAKCFDNMVIASKYIDLYKKLLFMS